MASVTLQVELRGPTENGGSCLVHYGVTAVDGLDPEIFLIKYVPPEYEGAEATNQWQHVAYADEMENVPTTVTNPRQPCFVRKASIIIGYTSLEKARVAIDSIKSQVQRLVNEVNTLAEYSEIKTYTITSEA